ncbi:uncharacterized protein LOC124622537 [Schistocerca americana]|uniref:uncharacterized protein LOC124622537 n=1 Tax=Schistocerca americana TaxID=7009 RepID=UPI001F4FD4BA|nr:uncharacterized protein LOC124622537 [Schistocerca americana]
MCVLDLVVITAVIVTSLSCAVNPQPCGMRSRGARHLVFPEGSTFMVRIQNVKKLQTEKPYESQPLWQQVIEVEELFPLPNNYSFMSPQRPKRPSSSSHQPHDKGKWNATGSSNETQHRPWRGHTNNTSRWKNSGGAGSASQWQRDPGSMATTRRPGTGGPVQKPNGSAEHNNNNNNNNGTRNNSPAITTEESNEVREPLMHPFGPWFLWFPGNYYDIHQIRPDSGEGSSETETADKQKGSSGKMGNADHAQTNYMYGPFAYVPATDQYQHDVTPVAKRTQSADGMPRDYEQHYDIPVSHEGKNSASVAADEAFSSRHPAPNHHGTYFPAEDYGTSCYPEPYYLHRRQRRQLYSFLESAIDAHGLDGRACILRAICEARDLPGFAADTSSVVADILRLVFTIPSGQTPDMREYETFPENSCWSAGCPFSLLKPMVADKPFM